MANGFFRLVILGFLIFSSWGAYAMDPMAYTVMGPDGQATLRWVTEKTTCPIVRWDDRPGESMHLRAAQEKIVARPSQQIHQKDANFELRSCDAVWPQNVKVARIESVVMAAPAASYKRIVIIADTGCRMKASDNAFQDCNDSSAWPYAEIAQQAAKKKPDLVVHIGDIHYRESPCPANQTGCKDSPWGYGSEAWEADFFQPSKPLLNVAPWLFVRGNHETCARAGQGWYRYIDAHLWQEGRSCNLNEFDVIADHSEPYIVPINGNVQFLVFDSSATAGKPLDEKSMLFQRYQKQLKTFDSLLNNNKTTIFLSHHPLLAIAPEKNLNSLSPGGNKALLSVFDGSYPNLLVPEQIGYLMHGHIHAFEAISFVSQHPSSFILGNSGSAQEGFLPSAIPAGFEVAPGAKVSEFYSSTSYGFALLEVPDQLEKPWRLTEFDQKGNAMFLCELANKKTHCVRP